MRVDGALLRLWEEGRGRAPVERALLLAQRGAPEASAERLLGLSIGQRDRLILELRRRLAGEALECQATCPGCGIPIAFTAQAGAIASLGPSGAAPDTVTFEADGREVTARAPTSSDLLALGEALAGEDAEQRLAGRCILRLDGSAVPDGETGLTPALLAGLNHHLNAIDPLGNLTVGLECPSCARAWDMPLDIASFLWHELERAIRELLREVHWIASAYGWPEADILELGDRRRIYLDLIGA
jgi:hypothetical protein